MLRPFFMLYSPKGVEGLFSESRLQDRAQFCSCGTERRPTTLPRTEPRSPHVVVGHKDASRFIRKTADGNDAECRMFGFLGMRLPTAPGGGLNHATVSFRTPSILHYLNRGIHCVPS